MWHESSLRAINNPWNHTFTFLLTEKKIISFFMVIIKRNVKSYFYIHVHASEIQWLSVSTCLCWSFWYFFMRLCTSLLKIESNIPIKIARPLGSTAKYWPGTIRRQPLLPNVSWWTWNKENGRKTYRVNWGNTQIYQEIHFWMSILLSCF